MTLFENLFALRRAGQVRRFHTEYLIVPETVAHHSAGVALILIKAARADRTDLSARLLTYAILHDLDESMTGDIPAPTKWMDQILNGSLERVEKKAQKFLDIGFCTLSPEEKVIFKAADFLDVCMKCLEERLMGNTMIDPVFERLHKYNGESRVIYNSRSPAMEELYEGLFRVYATTVPSSGYQGKLFQNTDFWADEKKQAIAQAKAFDERMTR